MKLLVVPAGLALALVPALGIAPAAHAASTYTVTINLGLTKANSVGTYGDEINFDPSATSSAGYAPGEGTYDLQELAPGSSSWRTVKKTTQGQPYLATMGVKFKGNAVYRLYYEGYTDPDSGDVFSPATSNTKAAFTLYNVKVNQPKHTTQSGKVSPSYAHKKVTVTQGKKTIVRTRTDGKGHFTLKFRPGKVGSTVKYVLHFAGSKKFTATKYTEKLTWYFV